MGHVTYECGITHYKFICDYEWVMSHMHVALHITHIHYTCVMPHSYTYAMGHVTYECGITHDTYKWGV